MFKAIWIALAIAFGLIVFPALPVQVGIEIVGPYDEAKWNEFHADAYAKAADEFTALFNSYGDDDPRIVARVEFTALFDATEIKWSKNGRLMVKGAHAKSYRFARRA